MPIQDDKTIYTLASAAGRAGVAVVRLSGPSCAQACEALTGAPPPPPRQAVLKTLRDPHTKEHLDHALVLFFEAPHSFTGEDVLELHIHGSRAVLQALFESLAQNPSLRPAQAGEFARRAFENDKMDLTQAEGLADLIDAETAAQRRQALRQMEGDLGALYKNWAADLTQLLAMSEAALDFADEDIPQDLTKGHNKTISVLIEAITQHLCDNHRGERLRHGFVVALLGAPNVGKSSLLNALVKRNAAIVSPIPGTTRDIIEVSLDLGGYPVTLADTAGLRETADQIEHEGVRRALERATHADLKLVIMDASQSAKPDPTISALLDKDALLVVNKIDLVKNQSAFPQNALLIAAKTGEGLEHLTQTIINKIETAYAPTQNPTLTRARHRYALEKTLAYLKAAQTATQDELTAEELRLALRSLSQITGHVDVEDLLDIIFGSFCIGK
ncbi:MAG: tRNA uridine-5-carboxymethylaminomethyl(34) synthesis GTPase MnmE [Alphaproteobacteria bacterium]|nr:tRNA uridine-5-carboxymethylaminomethyl(34) synthesis GTPase MnmE [Alphaproteobacteria bacterium]